MKNYGISLYLFFYHLVNVREICRQNKKPTIFKKIVQLGNKSQTMNEKASFKHIRK